MLLTSETKLDFSDVLIVPKRSTLESRSNVDLIKNFTPKYGKPFSGLGIIAANMATGTFEMLDVFKKYKMFVAIAKHFNQRWYKDFNVEKLEYGFYTLGMSDEELTELINFSNSFPAGHKEKLKICIDIANGYTQKFSSFVSKVRKVFNNNVIVAGNVATPEMVQELIIAGADYVKCGIGPGSQCATRRMTGVGYPQLSAAIECADSAHGLGAGIVLDGGMRSSGDIAKAFCANSDLVMVGGMFAGSEEQDGEIISRFYKTDEVLWQDGTWQPIIKEKKFKVFYGMSSELAQEKHGTGMKEYRASEGTVEEVPYTGSVENKIKEILGGLRSTGTYIGAKSLKDFGKCSTFVRVNRVHDKN